MDFPQIPGYTIQKEIGRGARGVVYLARHGDSDYAIKVQNSAEDRSLLRHGAILACTRHPGLPEVVEVGETNGRPYLVREYVPGYSLASETDAGPLPEARIVEIGKTLAGALNEVHRHGLIHRDVKPANILLARSGGVRLIDFGFATRITATPQNPVGTYLYSAPEQTGMLSCPMDQRTDLYALGGVLFTCATGKPPYEATEPGELLRLHASAPVPKVRERNPDISLALAAIIEKLLSKDPQDRYQTGHSLLSDLRALPALNQRLAEGLAVVLGEHSRDLQGGATTMVGREAELQELLAALERALQRDGQSVLIEGEGGCGKTLLADEFLKRAGRLTPLLLRARCEPGAAPFSAVRQWLNSYFAALAELPLVARQRLEAELRNQSREQIVFWVRLGEAAAGFFGEVGEAPEDEAGDQFLDAAAQFFGLVANLHGGAVLLLDDAHNLDQGSRQVVNRLCSRLSKTPLLLLASSRSASEASEGLQQYLACARPKPRLALSSLDNAEVEVLVYSMLGSRPVSSELTRLIAIRSHGNPFAVTEYVRAMLNAGVIFPAREGWRFDQASLQSLELPDDVLQLVLRRMAQLGAGVQALLRTAALLGSQISVEFLAAIEECSEKRVREDLEAAARAHVVEAEDHDLFQFVHDRIREAFLSELAAEAQREAHLRVARGLEKLLPKRPELIYLVARHYGLSGCHDDRVYETSLEAGQQALREFAFADAYTFLSQAARSCQQAQQIDWMEPLSLACEHTNRAEEAIELLSRLLTFNQPPLAQAHYLVRLSKLRTSKLDRAGALDECRKALAAIGRGVLDHPLWNGIAAGYCFSRWVWAEFVTGWSRGCSRGQRRELDKVLAALFQTYSEGEYFEMHYPKMLEMASRACMASYRLGVSPQLVTTYSNIMVFSGMLRKKGLIERLARRIEGYARELGDPLSYSYFEIARCISLHIAGLSEEVDSRQEELLSQRSHLLEPWAFMLGVADLSWNLMMRGQVRKAWGWVQRGLERCRLTSSPAGVARDVDIMSCYAISCLAILGHSGEALNYVERLKEKCHQPHTDKSLRANYFAHMLALHLETRDLGKPMEQTGAEFFNLKLNLHLLPLHRRHFYVFWAYCWLERCYKAEPAPADVRQLDYALDCLRTVANRPLLQGHYLVARAGREFLKGDYRKALQTLSRAQEMADLHDAPWISYEAARVRARVLTRLRKYDVAAREAERAYHLALEFGWSSRARAIAKEFSLARTSSSLGSASVELGAVKPSPEDTLRIRLERQLEALLHLSLASSQLVSPKDQTRVVLDELIRLLNAERAYVFLANPGGLFFFTGRDNTGATLDVPSNYSSTVVERVRQTREPLVVAGTEEGETMGARSVIDHNLRSIICAPLSVREEFAGVIYLDNKLARGVFNPEDVSILRAVSNHISVGIETARAARLEVEVESERRQRALADVLSEFSMSLSSTLEPDAIVQQLLETLSRAVQFSRAAVWMGQPEELSLVAQRGYPDSVKPGAAIVAGEHRGFDRATETKRPVLETCQGHEPVFTKLSVPGQFSWLAVPLLSDRRVSGVVTLSADRPDAYSEAEVEVAFTFCNQAGIALANAHLFKEINRLATTDSLTGCYNRRRFFQIAEREVERCRRESMPLSVIMTDIDFFKKFNDEHGHACGDEVLRRVAHVCREVVGSVGTVGRFGGEEFAAVLSGFDAQACSKVADRLRQAVEANHVEFEGKSLKVTLSLGVATLGAAETLEQVLARADEALYESKRGGRNRVCVG